MQREEGFSLTPFWQHCSYTPPDPPRGHQSSVTTSYLSPPPSFPSAAPWTSASTADDSPSYNWAASFSEPVNASLPPAGDTAPPFDWAASNCERDSYGQASDIPSRRAGPDWTSPPSSWAPPTQASPTWAAYWAPQRQSSVFPESAAPPTVPAAPFCNSYDGFYGQAQDPSWLLERSSANPPGASLALATAPEATMQDQVPFPDIFPSEVCSSPAILETDASKSWPVNPGGKEGQRNKDFPGGPFEAPPLSEAPGFDAAGRPSTAEEKKNLDASPGHQHESSQERIVESGDMGDQEIVHSRRAVAVSPEDATSAGEAGRTGTNFSREEFRERRDRSIQVSDKEREAWLKEVREKEEEREKEADFTGFSCAVCGSGRKFSDLHSLMDHAKSYKKRKKLREHSVYSAVLEDARNKMGCQENRNRGVQIGSLEGSGGEGGKRGREGDATEWDAKRSRHVGVEESFLGARPRSQEQGGTGLSFEKGHLRGLGNVGDENTSFGDATGSGTGHEVAKLGFSNVPESHPVVRASANVCMNSGQGEGLKASLENLCGAQSLQTHFEGVVKAFRKEIRKFREKRIRGTIVQPKQPIRCVVCNSDEYPSLSALKRHAVTCRQESRQHAALHVAVVLEDDGGEPVEEKEGKREQVRRDSAQSEGKGENEVALEREGKNEGGLERERATEGKNGRKEVGMKQEEEVGEDQTEEYAEGKNELDRGERLETHRAQMNGAEELEGGEAQRGRMQGGVEEQKSKTEEVHKVEVEAKEDHGKEEGPSEGESRETEGGEAPREVDESSLMESDSKEEQGQLMLHRKRGAESEQTEGGVAERNEEKARAEAERESEGKDTAEPEGRKQTAAVRTEESDLEPVPGGRKERKHVRNSRSFWYWALQRLKRSHLEGVSFWWAKAEAESERTERLEKELEELRALREEDRVVLEDVKKRAEDEREEAERKLKTSAEEIERERVCARASAEEAQALREDLLARGQRDEEKRETTKQAEDPPGCAICFEPWSEEKRRGALTCGHATCCTGCIADYFRTKFARDKKGKRPAYRCPLGCALRSNRVLELFL